MGEFLAGFVGFFDARQTGEFCAFVVMSGLMVFAAAAFCASLSFVVEKFFGR